MAARLPQPTCTHARALDSEPSHDALPSPACVQMNVVSMAPITASQFGTNKIMQSVVLKKADAALTGAERFGCAAVAGAVSAFIASPSELIIIHQQVTKAPGRLTDPDRIYKCLWEYLLEGGSDLYMFLVRGV